MKKNYFFIGLILIGFISSATAADITIQVDLRNASDLYTDGSVWIMMDSNWDEYYDMVDVDSDKIFEYTVSAEEGEVVYYKFAYQNGPDPWNDYVEETVPDGCSAENGLRMYLATSENVTLPPVVYESCFETGITLRVDLRERSDVYEGGFVWVVMDDNWEEYYDMVMFDEGIYYYTLIKEAGITFQYSFSYQTGPDPNNDYVWETVPAECANENGYRELLVPEGDTILPAFLYGSCDEATGAEVPTYLTTFNVDMNNLPIIDLYEGGSVWLNINNWSEWYDMADDDMDNIYSIEMEQDSGSTIYYRFAYQTGPDPDWDYIDEAVPEACESEDSPGNREHKALENTVLPNTVFSACGVAGDPGTNLVNVGFSCKLEGDSVETNGLWMVSKDPWHWTEMLPIGENDGVYTAEWQLLEGQQIPYTFVYGGIDNWDGEESVPEACNFGDENSPQRLFEGAWADSILPVIPYGECLGDVTVTYLVDMSKETMNEGDIVWVYIWNTEARIVMTDDNEDGIFEVDISHTPGDEISYYYVYGTESIYDEENVPAECSVDGWRVYTVPEEDHVLPSFLYGACDVTGISEFEKSFSIYPNPVKDVITIEVNQKLESIQISIVDITGRNIKTINVLESERIQFSIADLNTGVYFLQFRSMNNTFSRKVLKIN